VSCYRYSVAGALPPDERLIPIDDAADKVGRDRWTLFRWIRIGLLTPYKKRGDRRTHIDLAELPEAMRRAGRPGPKPRGRRGVGEVEE
jgi:hypothetical protein